MEIFHVLEGKGRVLTIAARLTTEADAWECGFYPNVELPRSAQWRATQPNEQDKLYMACFPGAQIYAYAGAVNNADAAAHRLATRPNYVYADNIAENFHHVFLNAKLSKGLVGPRRKAKRVPRVYDDSVVFHDFTLNGAKVVVAVEHRGFEIRFGGARDVRNSGGEAAVSMEALKHTAWSRLQIRPIIVRGTLENARDVEWVKNVVQSVGTRGYRETSRHRGLPPLELSPKPRKTLPALNDVQFEWIHERKRVTCVAYVQDHSETLGFFVWYGAATVKRGDTNNTHLGELIALGRLKVRPVCIGDHRGRHASGETWLKRIRRFGRRNAKRFNRLQ